MTPTRKIGLGGFLLGSVVAGSISLATLGSASAAPVSVSATTAAADDTTASTAPADTTADDTDTDTDTDADADSDTDVPAGPHSANGITEEELTGDTAASVEAAVVAAYPDATIERMETDADGAAFEAHITLADGSRATVELDATFTITATETGGRGGHGGGHGGGGPHTANGITEEELTGDAATSVEAAVLAAYPDATIERMETDADGAAYEAHVTLADGTETTVNLDDAFVVTGTAD